jgi:DNA-binding FrmR family transcriptional regulator
MQEKNRKSLTNRLNRIEGQVRGINKMVAEDKYCVDIITQISAIKSSLTSVEALILENHLEEHVIKQMKGKDSASAIKEMLKIYKLAQK